MIWTNNEIPTLKRFEILISSRNKSIKNQIIYQAEVSNNKQ